MSEKKSIDKFIIKDERIFRLTMKPEGFSLIEVIVAMVIVSVAAMAVMAAHTTAQRTTGEANRDTRALYLAQAYLEETLAKDFADITSVSSTDVPGYSGYTYKIEVTTQTLDAGWVLVDDESSSLFKKITVTVSYPGPEGDKEISLTTEKRNDN